MQNPQMPRRYALLPYLIIGMAVFGVTVGGIALHSVETRMVERAGEALALAAADIADKLDRILSERYDDIQIMAQTPVLRSGNPEAMSSYLRTMQKVSPIYVWLGVTEASGRIIAATDPGSVGRDRSGRPWFQAVRNGAPVHVRDAAVSEDGGGVRTVSFTAPIKGSTGEFLGALTSRVELQPLEDVFARTVYAFEVLRGASSKVEWQFLSHDGEVIVDSTLRQEGKVNLKQSGLPSALLVEAGQPGYVVEEHLRRHVPVVTGYARTGGYGRFTGLKWGVLVRMDESVVLAPIRAILWKVGIAGIVIWAPMVGLLLWSTKRLQREWAVAQLESARARAAELEVSEREERTRKIFDDAPIGMALVDSDYRFIKVNRVLCEMLEYGEQELLTKSFTGITHQDDLETDVRLAKQVFKGELPSYFLEKRYLTKTGAVLWVHLTATVIRDQTGRILHGLAMIKDITARKRAEGRQAAQLAVGLALAESVIFSEAAPRILQAVCDSMEWELGAMWLVDSSYTKLQCETIWHVPSVKAEEFVTATREKEITQGVGLPGRVWAAGEPAWIPDVVKDPNFPRAPFAVQAGLHGAFGFPIRSGSQFYGVMEFFSREIREPDTGLLAMMADVGLKIGQFVERQWLQDERIRLAKDLRLLLESTGEGIYGIDMEGRCIFVNQAAARMFGYEPNGLLGKGMHVLIHHSRADRSPCPQEDCLIDRVSLTGQDCRVSGDVFWRRDGTMFPVEYASYPIRDGDVIKGAVVIFTDITERQRVEKELRESEQRFQLINDNANDAIFYLDVNGVIQWANQKASAVTGRPMTEIVHRSLMALLTPPSAAVAEARLAAIRSGQSVPPVVEFELFCQDDSTVWVEANITSVLEQGVTVGRLVVSRDITERKQIEQRLRQSEKLAALGTLLDGVAHELNNPLFMIDGFAQLAGEKIKQQRYQDLAGDLASIHEASRRAKAIVQRTLTVTRQQKGGVRACDVNALLKSTLDLVANDLTIHNVEGQIALRPDLPLVLADPQDLTQLFLNLITNARQAMVTAHGRGILRISSALLSDRQKPFVEVRFADDGPGIPPEIRSRIFEPFFTTKPVGEGTGLGLSICHRIVGELRGALNLESVEGQGAIFVLRLPAMEPSNP